MTSPAPPSRSLEPERAYGAARPPDHVAELAALGALPDTDTGLPPVDPSILGRQRVHAVLVAHDGARWLERSLAALAASHRRPDSVVAVDTGSTDATPELLRGALGDRDVVRVERVTGFGAAVDRGLEHLPAPAGDGREDWVWVLHDDCAPEPAALDRLLDVALRHPEAGIVGPKVRDWSDDGRQLLEMGITITGAGRRFTGLERREYDQGQHDAVREVLAVGSAGMLVRRDVWDQLGGLDPHLPLFRDDVDLGWRANAAGHRVLICPDAVVRHAEAAAHGRRRPAATRERAHLLDRRHALYVLLANGGSRLSFPLLVLRVVLGAGVRSVGFLLGKQPAIALEELRALGSVLSHPRRLLAARRSRREARRVPPGDLRALFPGFGVQMRQAADTMRGVLSGTTSGQDVASARRRAGGGGFDDEDDLEPDESVLRALLRPWVLLAVVLSVVAALAARSLLGGDRLSGGALLPAQDSAGDLWAAYVASWHTVGLGSATPAPPYLAVVAALGTLLLGNVSLAVDVLLVASIPLAGLSAWACLRGLLPSRPLRALVALVWAVVPATTGAVAAGRLGTAVLVITLPMLLRLVYAAMRTHPGDEPPRVELSFAAGLVLAVVTAFTPVLYVVAVVLAGFGGLLAWRRRVWLRLTIMLAVAPVVLLPWTLHVVANPSLLLVEAGLPGPDLSDPRLPGWHLLLGSPGGPGSAPEWLLAGVLLLAVAVLASRTYRSVVLAGWALALAALAAGVVLARVAVTAPTLATPVVAWAGPAIAVYVAGLLVAGGFGVQNAPRRLAGASFGWRQPVAAIVAVAFLAAPVVGLGWAVARGVADPLDRREVRVLPVYVADESARPERPRTVVLRRADDGRVTYALLRESGPRLGDAEVAPALTESLVLDAVVADLLSGRGGDAVDRLARFGVRYVFLPAPVDESVAAVLDAVAGLNRASAPEGSAMWRVDLVTARVRTVDPDGTETPVDSGQVDVSTSLPAGPAGRVLVLAEQADPGWQASLDGVRLEPQTVDGWAQGFGLPADGGRLEVGHSGTGRAAWLFAQALLFGIALVLALPGVRRSRLEVADAADLDDTEDTADAADTGDTAETATADTNRIDGAGGSDGITGTDGTDGGAAPQVPEAAAGRGSYSRGRRARPRRGRTGPLSAEGWLAEGGVPDEVAFGDAYPDGAPPTGRDDEDGRP